MRRRIENKSKIGLPFLSVVGIPMLILVLPFFDDSNISSMGFPFATLDEDLWAEVHWLENYGTMQWRNDSLRVISSKYKGKVRNASTNDLHKLLNYNDGYVKSLAFEGLCKRSDEQVFESLMLILDDTVNSVEIHAGCIGYPVSVAGYCTIDMLSIQVPDAPPTPSPKYDVNKLFTKNELALIVEKYEQNKSKYKKHSLY
jgi:hypothetical protein